MPRFLLAGLIAALLTGLWAASIAAVRYLSPPSPASATIAALLRPDDCAAPCLLGIELGRTTRDEGVARLRAHPWVGDVFTQGRPGTPVVWNWAATFPLAPQMVTASAIAAYNDLTTLDADDQWDMIDLVTHLPLGDVVAALGRPDQVELTVLVVASSAAHTPTARVRFAALYADGLTVRSAYLPCPVDPAALWNSPAAITVGDKLLFFEAGSQITLLDDHWPRWLFHLQPGERCG